MISDESEKIKSSSFDICGIWKKLILNTFLNNFLTSIPAGINLIFLYVFSILTTEYQILLIFFLIISSI
jgi:hypothetical protein